MLLEIIIFMFGMLVGFACMYFKYVGFVVICTGLGVITLIILYALVIFIAYRFGGL